VGLLPAVVAAVALLTGVVAPVGARAVAVLGRRWRGTGALWADVPERSFGPRALGGIGMGLAVCLPELLGDAIGPSVLGGLLAVHVLAAPGGEEPAPGARAG